MGLKITPTTVTPSQMPDAEVSGLAPGTAVRLVQDTNKSAFASGNALADGTFGSAAPVKTKLGQHTVTAKAPSGAIIAGPEAYTVAVAVPPPLPPVALFAATPMTGVAPLTVAFTDTSTGTPTSRSWDFGDGGTSTIANPTHTYAGGGTYAARLTVSNAAGSSQAQTTIVATASVPPPTTEKSTQVIIDLINAAPAGGTVTIPAGIYRGPFVNLNKRVTLDLSSGASIRGSDIFTFSGAGPWTSSQVVPTNFAQPTRWTAHPHQVFMDDERLVYGTDFTVDATGHVILTRNPTGKRVEVALRERPVFVSASDVTIIEGDVRHSLNPTQSGAIQVSGYGAGTVDRFILDGTAVSDAQGGCVSLNGGSGHRIRNAPIARGGQLGLHLSGAGSFAAGEPENVLSVQSLDWQITKSSVADCNWGQFDYGWECGDIKALWVDGLLFEDLDISGTPNTVFDGGRGIWTDTGVKNLVVRRVRQHGTALGMFLESARDGLVEDNVVYGVGWLPSDTWHGSLVLASSGRFTVQHNTIAKSVDGLRYNGQNRTDDPAHTGIRFTANDVLEMSRYGTGWGPDRNDPYLADPTNVSVNNRYWHVATVSDYPAKESGSVQLTDAQAAAIYAAKQIP